MILMIKTVFAWLVTMSDGFYDALGGLLDFKDSSPKTPPFLLLDFNVRVCILPSK
jgi:hypothetical protein